MSASPVPSPVQTVHAWLTAASAGDVDAVLSHTAPDVIMVGPRGTASGHDVLRHWLRHAGASFETRASYARGSAVVVEQRGVWRDAHTGEVIGTADVATRFRVTDDGVAELERYDNLAAALAAAGLSHADESDLAG